MHEVVKNGYEVAPRTGGDGIANEITNGPVVVGIDALPGPALPGIANDSVRVSGTFPDFG